MGNWIKLIVHASAARRAAAAAAATEKPSNPEETSRFAARLSYFAAANSIYIFFSTDERILRVIKGRNYASKCKAELLRVRVSRLFRRLSVSTRVERYAPVLIGKHAATLVSIADGKQRCNILNVDGRKRLQRLH